MNELYWLGIPALTVAVLIAISCGAKVQQADFFARWPAISDEEFVARCSPGTNRDTALRVRRIVSEQLGIPYENVYPEQHFLQDLDCD
ncbi:MAG: hypothetical protein ACE361_16180 [Aureliella sp.]